MQSYKSDTIGGRIKALREQAGLKQRELASKVHVSRELINMWENDARLIKGDDIARLSDALGTTCDYLLRGVSSDNLNVHEITGLSNGAIEWLKAASPEHIGILNTLLEHEELAGLLCSSMYLYAMSTYTSVTFTDTLTSSEQKFDIGDSKQIIKYNAQQSLSLVLDKLRSIYSAQTHEMMKDKIRLLKSRLEDMKNG